MSLPGWPGFHRRFGACTGAAGSDAPDPDITAAMAPHFTPGEIVGIDAIARRITFANLWVGTAGALRGRLRR